MMLREIIQFVHASTLALSDGSFAIKSYPVLYECRADVKHVNSNREFQQMQIANNVQVEIKIRYAFGKFIPKVGMLIKWRGKILTVSGQPDLGEKNWLTFTANYDPETTLEDTEETS